jgi:hypothetical protein
MAKKKIQHAFDKFLQKIISRKLLVWLAATAIFAFTKNMSSSDWVMISAIYIGGQTVIDAVKAMKGNSKMSSSVSTTVNTVLGNDKKKDETGKVSATANKTQDTVTK